MSKNRKVRIVESVDDYYYRKKKPQGKSKIFIGCMVFLAICSALYFLFSGGVLPNSTPPTITPYTLQYRTPLLTRTPPPSLTPSLTPTPMTWYEGKKNSDITDRFERYRQYYPQGQDEDDYYKIPLDTLPKIEIDGSEGKITIYLLPKDFVFVEEYDPGLFGINRVFYATQVTALGDPVEKVGNYDNGLIYRKSFSTDEPVKPGDVFYCEGYDCTISSNKASHPLKVMFPELPPNCLVEGRSYNITTDSGTYHGVLRVLRQGEGFKYVLIDGNNDRIYEIKYPFSNVQIP